MHLMILLLVAESTFAQVPATPTPLDTFGIIRLHPSAPNTREWNSSHWANGRTRTLKYAPDPDDPTGWTEDHSGSSDGFRIDGNGLMTLSGGSPRFHINSTLSSKVPARFYRNVEFTAYAMSLSAGGANYGGMVVGVRSGPLGHASSGGDDCDATTYYARFRNDGKWDFEKELKHPGSTYRSGTGLNKQDPLWGGARLPRNRWIGMKFVVRDIVGIVGIVGAAPAVRLELYIDSTMGGNPTAGGDWRKVGEAIDDGSWPSGDVSGCGYAQNSIISPGNGTLLWRTDGDTVLYKMVSIREIEPDFATSVLVRQAHGEMRLQNKRQSLRSSAIKRQESFFRRLLGRRLP
jgi:hypothetical protein